MRKHPKSKISQKKFDEIVAAFGGQKELAKALCVSQPSVSKWRKNGVSLAKVSILCNKYNKLATKPPLRPSDFYPTIFPCN